MDIIVESLIDSYNLNLRKFNTLSIVQADNKKQAISFTRRLVNLFVARDCVFFLSGGKTPMSLYKSLALDKEFLPAAVGMIDERYGKLSHQKSNEKAIVSTGFISSLQKKGIRFYPILQAGLAFKETAYTYDNTVRFLLSRFKSSLGLLGLGSDGHVAGITPGAVFKKDALVSYAYNPISEYVNRITFTFVGLSMLDNLIVLVLGKEKKKALELILEKKDPDVVPGTFLLNNKALLITDQKF